MKFPTVSDLDHPMIFLFFLTLALLPIFVLVFLAAQHFGLIG